MLDNYMAKKLMEHIGHNVVIAPYVDNDGNTVDVCLECEDCNEIVIDAEDYNEDYNED